MSKQFLDDDEWDRFVSWLAVWGYPLASDLPTAVEAYYSARNTFSRELKRTHEKHVTRPNSSQSTK